MGVPLNSRFDIESDLRFIVVAKQIVFYQIVEDEYISVVRILDGRQDYMAILFVILFPKLKLGSNRSVRELENMTQKE